MTGATVPLSLPHPIQVLPKLRGTNAREANPQKALVQGKQSAAPAQSFAADSAQFVQIDDALDLERSRIRNHDVPVDGGEIEEPLKRKPS